MKNSLVVGFIGTGVMGKSMAKHIMNGGYKLNVYNRTKEKAKELLEQGASWYDTVGGLATNSDVIITIVGYPSDVEQVYLGEDGILQKAKPGSFVIDMTTSTPLLAQKISKAAKEKGIEALDAPVSGGDIGAKEGKLSIMVGGDEKAFESVLPIFSLMGENIQLQGPAGSGQYTKMTNQIVIAGTMMGVSEAMVYAKKAGLDQKKVLQSIETGAAGSFSLSKLAPRMIDGDFDPGFYIKHFIKDMKIAIESAEEMGLNTPGLKLAKQLYEELSNQEEGNENLGTQALYKYYLN
ncbi:NAD(P)-dependent oxidoreductase [Evansella sp. AB-P1]|uniref:NAD(P)-dependent oxidoreductase n=1 Tax=Evansella sp. AB-P1 TaxID=3037653 RepID=UPI00241C9F76|nr:NAD(P)-dependent oxidoreductase [Evansella sp. AB-P1]MDG5787407.1 NAD(P)-dependent oxidoreductase [Evansella sp. AB-P1]